MPHKRLPGFEKVRPPRPDIRHAEVALIAAQRMVEEFNLDDFYWSPEEKLDCVCELQASIMQAGNLIQVYNRLPPKRWHWPGVQEHFIHYYERCCTEVECEAVAAWREKYDATL